MCQITGVGTYCVLYVHHSFSKWAEGCCLFLFFSDPYVPNYFLFLLFLPTPTMLTTSSYLVHIELFGSTLMSCARHVANAMRYNNIFLSHSSYLNGLLFHWVDRVAQT